MTDEHYTVKINRRDGVVEITGSDKDWIAEQLERLAVVYIEEVADADPPMVSEVGAEPVNGDGTAGGDDATGTAPKPATRRKKGGGYRGTRNAALVAELTADVQQKLATYQDARKSHWKDATDQAAIVAKFLKDERQMDGVTPDDLYTVFDVMGWRGPNPKNALQNARYRNRYFTSQDGKYML
ncbi:MAG TPA: hypothetical protein VGO71_04790, partial [Baekduia sp.]|nr:hypothetical protein [Baekduia sp.]